MVLRNDISNFNIVKLHTVLILSDSFQTRTLETNKKIIAFKSINDGSYYIFIFNRDRTYEEFNFDSSMKILSHSFFAGYVGLAQKPELLR